MKRFVFKEKSQKLKFMKRVQITGLLSLTIVAILFLSGCYKPWHRIEGNHDPASETRYPGSFQGIDNRGAFDVYIIPSDDHEVIVEAESNLVPLIRTHVNGSTLIIDTKDNLRPHLPMKIYVYAPGVNEAKLSGSGSIRCDSLDVDKLNVELSGSGDIEMLLTGNDVSCWLSGSGAIRLHMETVKLKAEISGSGMMEFDGFADRADLNISGSGSFHAYDLPVDECYARISGSGDMYVSVNNYLDVNISGSGNVYYLGNPVVHSKITGSGSVIHP